MILYCNDTTIVHKVKIADTFISKFTGLMGKKNMDCDEGLLLLRCQSIHCYFMKIPIDAVYISKDMNVLEMETILPWHIGRNVKNTAHVLEVKAETAAQKLAIGDQLILCEDTKKPRYDRRKL